MRASGCVVVVGVGLALACGGVPASEVVVLESPEAAPAEMLEPVAPRQIAALELRMIDTDAHPDAVCHDGSPAVFYVRRGTEADKWVVWFKGGGECVDAATCKALDTALTSSVPWQQIDTLTDEAAAIGRHGKASGILSADPELNPDFHSWNHVYLPYCTADWWTGTRYASKQSGRRHFQGANVADAILATLQDPASVGDPSLDQATQLILAGSSAGAIGMRHHLDRWAEQLQGVEVSGLSDANLIPNTTPVRGLDGGADEAALRQRLELWSSRLDASCVAAVGSSNEWRCMRGRYLLVNQHLSTPTFWRMDQLDPLMLGTDYDPDDPAHRMLAQQAAAEIKQSLEDIGGGFCPATGRHVVVATEHFHSAAIDGQSVADVFGNWVFGRPGPKLLLEQSVMP